jgi:hypothetical protein
LLGWINFVLLEKILVRKFFMVKKIFVLIYFGRDIFVRKCFKSKYIFGRKFLVKIFFVEKDFSRKLLFDNFFVENFRLKFFGSKILRSNVLILIFRSKI